MAMEQYGSQKNLSAILHAVNKVLSFDLIRQYKAPAALCSNDAKSCYDRINHSMASLCFQHQGVPEPPLVSHAHDTSEYGTHDPDSLWRLYMVIRRIDVVNSIGGTSVG
jgi:hypothetical protein